jgi:phage FluMu protein Com
VIPVAEVPSSAYGRRAKTPPTQREVGSSAGLQQVFVDEKPRCSGLVRGAACNKLLANFATRPWSITCRHCRTVNVRNTPAPPGDTATTAA